MPRLTIDKHTVRSESTRSKVRAWVIARIRKEAEVEIPELAKDAINHFSRDSGFKQALFEESLYEIVYAIANRAVGSTRSLNPIEEITGEPGDAPPVSVFYRWMEHCGDRHVAVLNMTKEDLKAAEHERRERGAKEVAVANLWKYVREHMKSSDEMVADRFTSAQLETLHRRFVSGEEK